MKRVVSVLVVCGLLFAGCGGGGGGGSDDGVNGESFAGIWNGVLFLVQNDCPFEPDDDVIVSYDVNQDGERVVVNVPSGAVFSGSVDGPDGFTVTNDIVENREVQPGVFCDVDAGIRFSDRQGDQADAVALIRYTCASATQSAQCDVGYVGAVQKQG